MPSYDYQCSACGASEEVFQRITEEPLTICPQCGEKTFHRVVSGGAGVLYKGEGWYVTDYSKRSSGGKDASSDTASSSKPNAASTPPQSTPTTD